MPELSETVVATANNLHWARFRSRGWIYIITSLKPPAIKFLQFVIIVFQRQHLMDTQKILKSIHCACGNGPLTGIRTFNALQVF